MSFNFFFFTTIFLNSMNSKEAANEKENSRHFEGSNFCVCYDPFRDSFNVQLLASLPLSFLSFHKTNKYPPPKTTNKKYLI